MISMQTKTSLYQRVIHVTTDYLGPAAPRFIDRQIQKHIGKDPAELAVEDMPTLIDWSKIAIALLTDDRKIVMNYVEDLYSLYHESQ